MYTSTIKLLLAALGISSSLAFTSSSHITRSNNISKVGSLTTTPFLPVHKKQTHLFLGFLQDIFGAPEISSKETVLQAFKNKNAAVIDVRSPPEITTKVDAKNWINNAPGSPFDNPVLKDASKLLPDKSAPIIAYCASGKRSQKATELLKAQGYTNVFNAGSIGQIGYLPMKAA